MVRAAWLWLRVAAILGALALQMELPVAHAPAHAGFPVSGIAAAQAARPLELLAASAAHSIPHDPASCPLCQSLRAKPAAPPPAAQERPLPERAAALPAPAQRSHRSEPGTSHPPRAPPPAASSLV